MLKDTESTDYTKICLSTPILLSSDDASQEVPSKFMTDEEYLDYCYSGRWGVEWLRESKTLGHFANNIEVGKWSFAALAGKDKLFKDVVLYQVPKEESKGIKVDKLMVGNFAMTGAKHIIMGGTQGHDIDAISYFSLDYMTREALDEENLIPATSYKPKGDTIIGNDAFVGIDSVVMPGVKIGDGAIVAACSFVSRNIPPYQVWAGNPISFVRKRCPTELAERLIKIAWWDLQDSCLHHIAPFLRLPLNEENIALLEELVSKYRNI